MARPLDQLEKTIADRAAHPSDKSYTCQLLRGGVEEIGRKVLEEAAEVVNAAGQPGAVGQSHLVHEVADLFYHVMVMLRLRDCPLADVEAELERRFGVSGLEEKAGRRN